MKELFVIIFFCQQMNTCALCKGSSSSKEDFIQVQDDTIDDGEPKYLCFSCADIVKKALRTEKEKEADEENEYYHRDVCGCGYNNKSETCRGERCRRFGDDNEHSSTCEYWRCEACVSRS